jgi:hypothetical protein
MWDMMRVLPGVVAGAFIGFALGGSLSFALFFLEVEVTGWPFLGMCICGATVGTLIGALLLGPEGRAKAVARWCAVMTFVVGTIGFLLGFVGPIILYPDSPQGPLLGIFFTGPLGALVGAVLGAIVGLLVPQRTSRRDVNITS